MQELFSQENVIILGTMPKEIYIGYEQATKLVLTDWMHWGDCNFLIEQSHISTFENTAWISTIGTVKFDLSKYLVMAPAVIRRFS